MLLDLLRPANQNPEVATAVILGTADELIRPIEVFDEAGGTELRNGGGLKNEGVQRELVCSFIFHLASMTRSVGHWPHKPRWRDPGGAAERPARSSFYSVKFGFRFRLSPKSVNLSHAETGR